MRSHYDAGLTIRQLASLAGCSTNLVQKKLRLAGAARRRRGRRPKFAVSRVPGRRCMPELGYCPTGARLTLAAVAPSPGSSLGGEFGVGRSRSL
jgi:hypothetical protein